MRHGGSTRTPLIISEAQRHHLGPVQYSTITLKVAILGKLPGERNGNQSWHSISYRRFQDTLDGKQKLALQGLCAVLPLSLL